MLPYLPTEPFAQNGVAAVGHSDGYDGFFIEPQIGLVEIANLFRSDQRADDQHLSNDKLRNDQYLT